MHESGQSSSPARHFAGAESLPFSRIPGQSRLFIDFQADPGGLKRYYPNAITSYQELAAGREDVLAGHSADRAILGDSLLRINTRYGASPETLDAIAKLRLPETVAVLTGQQAGLFTGPAFSIYKAVTAIRVAESLNCMGVSAVPVFWAATEDHDHEEVSNTFALDAADRLFECRMSFPDEVQGNSVGEMRLNDSTAAALSLLFENLQPSEFRSELKEMLSSIWEPGTALGDAFGRTMSRLLGRYGLVIADPQDAGLKGLASPIYASAIERRKEIGDALAARGEALLKDGYHAQVDVTPDHIPLFWHDDEGRRLSLRQAIDGDIRVKGTGLSFAADDLIKRATDDPERFSPAVMLRPAVQDHIFPTICYVGGAAEVAYFAQNSEVYRVLGRRATPVIHRQSFTFVESRHRRSMEKFGLSLDQMFAGQGPVFSRVIDEVIDPGLAAAFDHTEVAIRNELQRLERALARFDVTLSANLEKRGRKIGYQINASRRKYYSRRTESKETAIRRLRAAFASLLPADGLQERTLNIFFFLNRLGPGFIGSIYNSVDLEDRGHRIVYL